jgi:UvrD-like helicase C-terminal domain/Nuclease-related domain/AAA domain
MTAGEKRMAQSLEANLDDDYTVWFDVAIGKKQLRPDFTILHPLLGILVLEVKDWKIDTIQKADRQSFELLTTDGVKNVSNPLEQARKYVLAINKLLCQDRDLVQFEGKYQGQLICPYGYGVVLANISRQAFTSSGLPNILAEHLVICRDEIRETKEIKLDGRLSKMYPYSFSQVVTPHQIDRIRWMMFPECRLPSKQLSLFLAEHPLEDADSEANLNLPIHPQVIPANLIQIFDIQQEILSRSLGDGHRVIHGVAGSGKTMILFYRCNYLASLQPQIPILVICFNVALSSRLREFITSQKLDGIIQVRHFHGWCLEQVRRHKLDSPQPSPNYIENLEKTVQDGIENGQIPRGQYSSILIDEGHDFEPDWFKMLTSTLNEQDSLLLLYDDAQNLYGRRKKFSFKSVGIKAQGRTSILKTNYRNTIEVLNLAYEFAKDLMKPSSANNEDEPVLIEPLTAGRHGQYPELVRCNSLYDEIKQVISLAGQLQKAGHSWNEIGIIYGLRFVGAEIYKQFQAAGIPIEWLNKDADSRFYKPKLDSIKLMTMHSCKGLEFANVIIPGLGYMPTQNSLPEDDARLLYVAMTRSTDRLIMTYHQESVFVRQLQPLIDGRSPR